MGVCGDELMETNDIQRCGGLIDPQGNLAANSQQVLIDYKLETIMRELSEIRLAQATNTARIEQTLEKHYVTRSDFIPIQKIVYGLVGLILTSFVVAILALVLRR